MEKELVKKILKSTNFTTTEIYRLIDVYKETTLVILRIVLYYFVTMVK